MVQQLDVLSKEPLYMAPDNSPASPIGALQASEGDTLPALAEDERSTPLVADPAQRRLEPFNIDRIQVGRRTRPLNTERLEALVQSISTIGLRSPITVRIVPKMMVDGVEEEDVPMLVAGLHRIEAVKKLGRKSIDCFVEPGSELDAQLWEIDENLCRSELTELERAEHLQNRKAIYEQMYPEVRQGGLPGAPGGGKAKPANLAGFAADTATKTGISERTVRRDARRASKIDPGVRSRIRDNRKIADSGAELDTLASMPATEQKRVIDILEAGQAVSVREAKKLLEDLEEENNPVHDAAEPDAAQSGEGWQGGPPDERTQLDVAQSEDTRPQKEAGQPEPMPHADEAEIASQPGEADDDPLDALLAAWNLADEETQLTFLEQIGARLVEPADRAPDEPNSNAAPAPKPESDLSLEPVQLLAMAAGSAALSDSPNFAEAQAEPLIVIFDELPPNTQKWARRWVSTGAPPEDTSSEVIRTTEARAPFRATYPVASPVSQAAFRQHLDALPEHR
jgi:ParB-like nuclease family protein